MVDHTAFRIEAASTRARISTFEVGTGLCGRTLRIGDALRPTFRRNTQVARHAGAGRIAAHLPALTVWTTR